MSREKEAVEIITIKKCTIGVEGLNCESYKKIEYKLKFAKTGNAASLIMEGFHPKKQFNVGLV